MPIVKLHPPLPRVMLHEEQVFREIEVELTDEMTLREFLLLLSETYPSFQNVVYRDRDAYYKRIRIALDHHMIPNDDLDGIVGKDSIIELLEPYLDG